MSNIIKKLKVFNIINSIINKIKEFYYYKQYNKSYKRALIY